MSLAAPDVEAVLEKSGPDFDDFECERPTAGHQGEVFLVTLTYEHEEYEVVVKFQTGGDPQFALEPRLHEFVADRTDIPVPRILVFNDEPDIDVPPYFVTERVRGDNLAESLTELEPVVRERIVRQAGEVLGKMHSQIGFEGFGRLALNDGRLEVTDFSWDWQQFFSEMISDYIDRLGNTPFGDLQTEAKAALDDSLHVIDSDAVPRLIHDDFRPANMLFEPDSDEPITSVLDWQFALAGDPEYHIARTDFLFIDPAFSDANTRDRLRRQLHAGYREHRAFDPDDGYDQRRSVYHFATLLWRMIGFEAAFADVSGLAQARAEARFRQQFEDLSGSLPTE